MSIKYEDIFFNFLWFSINMCIVSLLCFCIISLFMIFFINHIPYKSLLFGGVRYTDYVGDWPLLSNGRGTWGYFHITQSHNRPTICLISLGSSYFHFFFIFFRNINYTKPSKTNKVKWTSHLSWIQLPYKIFEEYRHEFRLVDDLTLARPGKLGRNTFHISILKHITFNLTQK